QHWFSPPVIEVHVYDITGGKTNRKSKENQEKTKENTPSPPLCHPSNPIPLHFQEHLPSISAHSLPCSSIFGYMCALIIH
ncbi:MAG: hypothetical protein UFE80_02440, partial [Christensenellales bacterium]|nr:hypothetical protein [Christensenellales bacterium]